MNYKLQSLYAQEEAATAIIQNEADKMRNLDILKNYSRDCEKTAARLENLKQYCKNRMEAFIEKRNHILIEIEIIVNSIITSN